MRLFDLFKRNNKSSAEITVSDNDEKDTDDKSTEKIGVGIALDSSVRASTAEAKVKFAKPKYNPQTRKVYYDDGKAHHEAIDRAFSSGKTVQDPYTGAELLKAQKEAKMEYGEDWQNHAAEADHIDPLHKFVNRHLKNPFATTEDLKEIGNSQDNYQILARKQNQSSKEVGKGGSSQLEWAEDSRRMEGLAKNIESGEPVEDVIGRIKNDGKAAIKRNDKRVLKRTVKNVAGTAHEAGMKGAINSGGTALTMSTIMNIIAVVKGEKSGEEALEDTIKTGGKAAVTGYVMGGGLTVLNQMFSYSSEFMQALSASNVPGKIITAISVTGDTLKRWGNGEISTQECIIQLGDKGLNMATMGYSAMVGQALIPIPIVGGAVGALVGSMLTSNLYNGLINELQTKQLEHEERMRIIAECNIAAEQIRAFRKELESYLDTYFLEYKNCFNEAMSTMQVAYQMGDADNVIASANQITRKLGGKVQYETVEEFKTFFDSDSIDEF